MKRIISTTILIFLCFIKGNAQAKIPQNISDDFAYSIIESYKNRYENFGIFIREKLRLKGYTPMDVDVLIESIVNNTKNRNIILEAFHDYFGRDEEYLYMNLSSFGISATNSKYLTEYIIGEKYKPTNLTYKEVEKPKIKSTNDDLDSVPNTPESKYFNYLNNLNSYSPKISTVCEDQGYSDCLRDVTSFVKELAELRTVHMSNENNTIYLKFYKTKTAIIEKRNWKLDAVNIDKYIVENNSIYEKTLKECGYDDLDWFKKLPKDLYKHFNLNKTEILNNIEVINNLEKNIVDKSQSNNIENLDKIRDGQSEEEQKNLNLLTELYNSVNTIQVLRNSHFEKAGNEEYMKQYKVKQSPNPLDNPSWLKDKARMNKRLFEGINLYQKQYQACLYYNWINKFPRSIVNEFHIKLPLE